MLANFDDYYDLLGVDPKAKLEEIQLAYRKTRSLYSPDSPAIYSMFSREEANQLLQLVDKAYQVLSQPQRRMEYDLQRAQGQRQDSFSEDGQDQAIYGLSGESSGEFSEHRSPISSQTNFPAQAIESSSAVQAESKDHGHTRFGPYRMDPEVENYICNEQNIDGQFLKTVREYKCVALDQIASVTKIGNHHLIAIEQNDFANLPPPVFTKAFVKQYAQLIGLDAQKCADSYAKSMQSKKP